MYLVGSLLLTNNFMENPDVIHALSAWIELKKLIKRENIYAPDQIQKLDIFLEKQAFNSLNITDE
jgi:hypothetical protein